MIAFLDFLALLLEWSYAFSFFWLLHTFLPVRKQWWLRIPAFISCGFLANTVVYSNDLGGLIGGLFGFVLYLFLFHRGKWIEKVTAILVFYPAFIAINYLMQNTGSRFFFWLTGVPNPVSGFTNWSSETLLYSTAIHTFFLLLRLLFWIGSWFLLKKYLHQTAHLTARMWAVIDMLMLASFISIFTIIYFMPEQMIIVYPICFASIFSSFGCIYLASYMCQSMQTAFHAQELEMQQTYYEEKTREEERIRRIYHDMKNHLLVLQQKAAGHEDVASSIKTLQEQINPYENYYQTGNNYLNIILRDKAQTAREKQIDFTPVIHFQDGMFIEPLDISTIFGNALDNAIEASEKLPAANRLITAKAKRVRDMLLIVIQNNASDKTGSENHTTKNDTFLHGFGLSNIKKAAEKYDGQCITQFKNHVFTLKIIIPIP